MMGLVDGNAPGNRTSFSNFINGLDWDPGEDLWFRWTIFDNSAVSVGVDNLSITIPEPSSAAILGLGAGLLVMRRGRARV